AILIRADRVGQDWLARRITGASGSGELSSTAPRVNLGGSWGRHGFCGGGRVEPAGADVSRVRVRFANGVELDDDTDGGWVLFFTNRPVEPPDARVAAPEGLRRLSRDAAPGATRLDAQSSASRSRAKPAAPSSQRLGFFRGSGAPRRVARLGAALPAAAGVGMDRRRRVVLRRD